VREPELLSKEKGGRRIGCELTAKKGKKMEDGREERERVIWTRKEGSEGQENL